MEVFISDNLSIKLDREVEFYYTQIEISFMEPGSTIEKFQVRVFTKTDKVTLGHSITESLVKGFTDIIMEVYIRANGSMTVDMAKVFLFLKMVRGMRVAGTLTKKMDWRDLLIEKE